MKFVKVKANEGGRHPKSHPPQEGSILIQTVNEQSKLNLVPGIDAEGKLVVSFRPYISGGPWDGQPYFGYTSRAQTLTLSESDIGTLIRALEHIKEKFAEEDWAEDNFLSEATFAETDSERETK